MVKRGEVWLTALDPTVGSDIQKTRPCVVISPPELHDHLRTATVAPMTSGGRPAPFRIELEFQGRTGRVPLDQTRAVDKRRLIRRLGEVEAAVLDAILAAMRDLFEA